MKTREEVHQDWINKNKIEEVKQAKLRAKDKLEKLDDKEKEVLTTLKNLGDKYSLQVVGQMLTLLNTIEAK